MAYVLIGIIAIKLLLSIPMIDIEIPAPLFGVVVIVAVIITLIIHYVRKNRRATDERRDNEG